jgi:hypothetical protein
MGWSFGWDSKKSLIGYITESKTSSKTGAVWTCLAHCYRGGRFSGVLWSVWSVKRPDAAEDRFILCDLLRAVSQKQDGGYGRWGNKSMAESSHPYQYSCPISYLDMAPEECAEWREGVRAYHEEHYRKLEKGASYMLRPQYHLSGGGAGPVKVVSLRPLRATCGGMRVRVSRKHLGEKVASAS